MDNAELVILETELAAQTREIERIYERIEERARLRTASGTESLSYQLHNLYSAFKELFEIRECRLSRGAPAANECRSGGRAVRHCSGRAPAVLRLASLVPALLSLRLRA